MDASSNRTTNFAVGNTLSPEPQLKSNNLTILQRTAMVVALAALAAMVPSALAGSFVASVICATVATAAVAVIAVVATILYKQSKLPKQNIAAPSKPATPVAPAAETPKPDTALQLAPNEKPLPLLQLPDEVLANLCTFLPLKALGHLGQINKKFADFLGSGTVSGQHAWKLIANKLGALLISPSEVTPKEQVKNLLIEFPKGKVDLLNNKLIMKVPTLKAQDFIHVFTKYVPEDYYLEQPIAFGASIVFYRKDNQVDVVLNSDVGSLAETALCDSIKETYKCFEVIGVK